MTASAVHCSNRLPLGDWMQERHGAPYWVVHRQDLLQALIAAAQALPEIEISLGSGVDSIKQGAGAVEITTTDGEQRTAALLVGADGLWSRVRGLLNPHFGLSYGGTLAARTVVERKGLKAPFNDLSTGVWLAPDAHVVHYPIDGGRRVAVVAIARGPEPAENWATPVSKVELTMRLMRLAPDLLGFLSQATEWRQWPLYSTPAVPTWADGRVLLLGDAAHPILPYLAQGGAMAIEDAFVLAAAIATHRGDPTLIAQHYLSERQQRTNRVRAASEQNGAAYHMRGIQAIGRNAVLRTTPAHLLMRRYDWIYGWRYQPDVHEVEL